MSEATATAEQTAIVPAGNNFEVLARTIAKKVGIEIVDLKSFGTALRASFGKAADNANDFLSALAISAQYGLNPLRNEIYILPTKSGNKPCIGIDGWVRIAQEHPQFAGWSFEEIRTESGSMVGVTCTLRRKDWPEPMVVTEWTAECAIATNALWSRMPARMTRNRAAIQAVRLGFGVTGIAYADAEEIIEEVSATVAKPVDQNGNSSPSQTKSKIELMKDHMGKTSNVAPAQQNSGTESEPAASQPEPTENAQDAPQTQTEPTVAPQPAEKPPSQTRAKAGGGKHPSGFTEDPDSLFSE